MRRIHAKALAPGFTCIPKSAIDAFGDKSDKPPFDFSGYMVSREQIVVDNSGVTRVSHSSIFIDAPTVALIKEQDAIKYKTFGERKVVAVATYFRPGMILDYGILYLD